MLIKLTSHTSDYPFLKHLPKGTPLEADFYLWNHPNSYGVTYEELVRKGVPEKALENFGCFGMYFFDVGEVKELYVYYSVLQTLEKMREQSNSKDK